LVATLSQGFVFAGLEVSLSQAEAIKSQGVAMILSQPGPIAVDLSRLEKANSVTVAVLVAWYRHARLQKKKITFINVPKDLGKIIEFSGLNEVLL